jgi:hypothetical protein
MSNPRLADVTPDVPVIPNNGSTNPALTVGVSATAVAGVIVLILNQFFPNLVSDDIEKLIYAVAAILLPIVAAWITRSKVWSPASVQQIVDSTAVETARAVNASVVQAVRQPTVKAPVQPITKPPFNE